MRYLILVLSTALTAAPSVIFAQVSSADAPEIEEVIVYGVQFREEGALEIRKEDLERIMATTLDDLFRDTPNVEALQGPGRQFFDFNIRGSEGAGNVIVSVDGVEKNLVETKHGTTFNPVFLAPDFLKSVNLIRGPVSNTFGTGSVGGRVQFENVDPFDYLDSGRGFGGSLRVGGEDNGDGFLATGIAAVQATDSLGLLLGMSRRDFDSYEDGDGEEVLNSGSESESVLAKAQWSPTAQWDIEASYTQSDFEYIGANIFARSNQRQDADFQNDVRDRGAQLAVDFRPSSSLHWHGDVFFSTTDHREILLEGRRGATGDPGDLDDRETETFGGKLYVSQAITTGEIRHDISVGVSGSRDELAYVGGTDVGGDRIGYGLFVQDRIALTERLVLIPGLRYELFDLKTDDDAESDGEELLAKLTANYRFTGNWSLFGSYADGLRAPRLNELLLGSTASRTRGGSTTVTVTLPSENLGPETSRSYELGSRWDSLFGDSVSVAGSLTLFRNDFRDRIDDVLLSSVTEGNTTTNTTRLENVGEAFTQGVEASFTADFGNFDASLNVAYTEGEREDTGEELNSVRPARGTVTVGWKTLDQKFRVQAELETFASKDEVGENDNVVGDSADGATLGNLFATYRLSDQGTVSLRINNITDVSYRRFDQIDPSIGRTIRGEVTLQF
ncbi:MAG: TonB-dependent receptor [Pseudomonadota bacterium]